jgi:hypothetical protein
MFVFKACGSNDKSLTDTKQQKGAHTKRLLEKTSPRQNVSIQNVYTHNVSLSKRLRHETSPVTKRLPNKTSPGLCVNARDKLS